MVRWLIQQKSPIYKARSPLFDVLIINILVFDFFFVWCYYYYFDMAVCASSNTSSRRLNMSVSMSLMQGTAPPNSGATQGGTASSHNASVHAASQPPQYYQMQHATAAAPSHNQEQVQPDRPIGYGAFGVVW